MRYFMNRLVWIVSVLTMIVAATSCGKTDERAAEEAIESAAAANGQKVDVDLSGDKMTIKTADGTTVVEGDKATVTGPDGTTRIDGNSMEMTSNDGQVKMVSGDNAAIPADFPKDVPIYPGAKVTMAASDAGEQTVTVTLQAQDTLDKVSEFVSKEAVAQGWKEDMVIKQPGDQPMHMLEYQKDNRILMYTLVSNGENVNISMSVQTEEETAEAAAVSEPPAEEAPADVAQPQ
ncbi:MAG: hypothetical protein RBU21_03830 [FCB group bacterium]|jgi:hypothetical protein|nr:hypothetical protein [FCB group bacterium]